MNEYVQLIYYILESKCLFKRQILLLTYENVNKRTTYRAQLRGANFDALLSCPSVLSCPPFVSKKEVS